MVMLKSCVFTISLLVSLSAVGYAQNPTSTYSQANVPTGRPIPGNYGGSLRPQVHFSPPQGFMNDPNGMFVDAAGTYHLYYQYNPTANVAGNQHWGHATSKDLYSWTNQQIAVFPGGPTEGIFSGSAVIDVDNTSGFFPNQTNGVVAIYTLNTPDRQDQNIAFSTDGGFAFTKYVNNPVIPSNSTQFRDPKVVWHEPTKKWVMAVAYPIDFKIGIFSSPNLIDWKAESNVSHIGVTGLQYECPNLVEIRVDDGTAGETRWVLFISINPGAPLGGSITEYFIGHFNGTHFIPQDATARFTDFGKDNYAGQYFYGIPPDHDQVSIAWASNWQYTNVVPTAGDVLGSGFRSTMSSPRATYLKTLPRFGLSLISTPYNIAPIYEQELAYNSTLNNGTLFVDYSSLDSGAVYFEANITNLTTPTLQGSLNFTISSSTSHEYVSGGTSIAPDNNMWLNRAASSNQFESNPYFTDKFSATGLFDPLMGSWRIAGLVDRSIIELWLNGGESAATTVAFPQAPFDQLVIRVAGLNETAKASVGVWGLRSGWAGQADSNGTVRGNITAG